MSTAEERTAERFALITKGFGEGVTGAVRAFTETQESLGKSISAGLESAGKTVDTFNYTLSDSALGVAQMAGRGINRVADGIGAGVKNIAADASRNLGTNLTRMGEALTDAGRTHVVEADMTARDAKRMVANSDKNYDKFLAGFNDSVKEASAERVATEKKVPSMSREQGFSL